MSFRRSVLAQMIICGIIALLGPGLWVSNQPFSFVGYILLTVSSRTRTTRWALVVHLSRIWYVNNIISCDNN